MTLLIMLLILENLHTIWQQWKVLKNRNGFCNLKTNIPIDLVFTPKLTLN